ncbi:hypothetical protein SK128_021646, partial [Halocaridina rubra]
MNIAHVISAPILPSQPVAVPRPKQQLGSSISFSDNSSSSSSIASPFGIQEYLPLLLLPFLLPLLPFMYFTGNGKDAVSTTGHLASVKLSSFVIEMPSVSARQQVSKPSDNGIGVLEIISSGNDLGVGLAWEEEERTKSSVEMKEKEQQKHQYFGLIPLAMLQEKLILLNQDNGVAENLLKIRQTVAAHNPTHQNRRKRSALSLSSTSKDEEISLSPTKTPALTIHPINPLISTLSPLSSTSSSTSTSSSFKTSIPLISSLAYNYSLPSTFPLKVNSTSLMNSPVILEASVPPRETKDVSDIIFPQLNPVIMTRPPDTEHVALGSENNDTKYTKHFHLQSLDLYESEERMNPVANPDNSDEDYIWNNDTDLSHSKNKLADSVSNEKYLTSATLHRSHLESKLPPQYDEKNVAQENATDSDYEYHEGPETLSTYTILPSFQENSVTQTLGTGTLDILFESTPVIDWTSDTSDVRLTTTSVTSSLTSVISSTPAVSIHDESFTRYSLLTSVTDPRHNGTEVISNTEAAIIESDPFQAEISTTFDTIGSTLNHHDPEKFISFKQSLELVSETKEEHKNILKEQKHLTSENSDIFSESDVSAISPLYNNTGVMNKVNHVKSTPVNGIQIIQTDSYPLEENQELISGIDEQESWNLSTERALRDMEYELDLERETTTTTTTKKGIFQDSIEENEPERSKEDRKKYESDGLGDLESTNSKYSGGIQETQGSSWSVHHDHKADPKHSRENDLLDMVEMLGTPQLNETQDMYVQPEVSALRMIDSNEAFNVDLEKDVHKIIHGELAEKAHLYDKDISYRDHESQHNSQDDSSESHSHQQKKFQNSSNHDTFTSSSPTSMTSPSPPLPAYDFNFEYQQSITPTPEPSIEQETFPANWSKVQSSTSSKLSQEMDFDAQIHEKLEEEVQGDNQSLVNPSLTQKEFGKVELPKHSEKHESFSSDNGNPNDAKFTLDFKQLSSFDYKEITIEDNVEKPKEEKILLRNENKLEQVIDIEPNKTEEIEEHLEDEAILPTPFSDISILSTLKESNENSYSLQDDSFYPPAMEDLSLDARFDLEVKEQMDDSSIAVLKSIGINDINPKNPREKLFSHVSFPSTNSFSKEANIDNDTLTSLLPPPSWPSQFTHVDHDIISNEDKEYVEDLEEEERNHIKTLEIENEKSASGSLLTQIASDDVGDKEFDSSSEGSLSIQEHNSLSENNPNGNPLENLGKVESLQNNNQGKGDLSSDDQEYTDLISVHNQRRVKEGTESFVADDYDTNEPYEYKDANEKDYESYEEGAEYEHYEGVDDLDEHLHEEKDGSEHDHEPFMHKNDSQLSLSYNNHVIGVTGDLERDSVEITEKKGKACDDDDTNKPAIEERVSDGHVYVSDRNIMPGGEQWESQDPSCKCSCQCSGSENIPISPDRVAANPSTRYRGDDHPQPSPSPPTNTSSTTTSTPSIAPTTTTPSTTSLDPPIHFFHRNHPHRHHHGDPTETTGSSTVTTSTLTPYIETIWLPSVNPHQVIYTDDSRDHDPQDNDEAGSISVIRPHQVAPPDGASFSALQIGEEASFKLAPYGYWNLHLTLSDPTDIRIVLTIPRGTSLGLYARRSALPTHTQHDIMRILRGTRPRDVRASPNVVEIAVEEVLEAGEWFLSLYNDDGEPHQVSMVITRGPGVGECPQRCNDRGDCILGRCQCRAGYSGVDCSQ